jgi:hypothetical protein
VAPPFIKGFYLSVNIRKFWNHSRGARLFQFLTNFGPHHVNNWASLFYLQPVARFVICILNGNDVCHGRTFLFEFLIS